MTPLPPRLHDLVSATRGDERSDAWAAFLEEYGPLVHLAARKSCRDHDDLMDRYTFVLESLRADDYRRLRAFEPDGRSKFTTWLVVVASRLCVDFHRRRYGRIEKGEKGAAVSEVRRRLQDLVGGDEVLPLLADPSNAPDEATEHREVEDALRDGLARLPHGDRVLVRLRFEDGRTAAECARILGLTSEFAFHRRQRRILGRLREHLLARGVEAPP